MWVQRRSTGLAPVGSKMNPPHEGEDARAGTRPSSPVGAPDGPLYPERGRDGRWSQRGRGSRADHVEAVRAGAAKRGSDNLWPDFFLPGPRMVWPRPMWMRESERRRKI